jgi:hypothetical protein
MWYIFAINYARFLGMSFRPSLSRILYCQTMSLSFREQCSYFTRGIQVRGQLSASLDTILEIAIQSCDLFLKGL